LPQVSKKTEVATRNLGQPIKNGFSISEIQ